MSGARLKNTGWYPNQAKADKALKRLHRLGETSAYVGYDVGRRKFRIVRPAPAATKNPPALELGRCAVSNPAGGGFDAIRSGARVTIVNRFGQRHTGRAVMRGPAGWVLNMGGPHGRPDIATPENTVGVAQSKTRRAGFDFSRNPPGGDPFLGMAPAKYGHRQGIVAGKQDARSRASGGGEYGAQASLEHMLGVIREFWTPRPGSIDKFKAGYYKGYRVGRATPVKSSRNGRRRAGGKPKARMVRILGRSVREGTKKHAELVARVKRFDDLGRNEPQGPGSAKNGLLNALFGKKVTYRRDVKKERATGRREHLDDLKYKAQVRKLEAELARADQQHTQAVARVGAAAERAEAKSKGGHMTEAEFERVKTRLAGEIQKADRDRASAVSKLAGAKRNPEGAAAELSAEFHGAPPEFVRTVIEHMRGHGVLSELADLVQLVIKTPFGARAELNFPLEPADRVVRLGASEEKFPDGRRGKQLYFRGGDQELPLAKLGFSADWLRDRMVIGELVKLTYRTKKKMHEFKLVDYWHRAGEETGDRPLVLYDYSNKKLELAGGRYWIDKAGIHN